MTKKKLIFICTFILIMLAASGISYYNTYSSVKNDIIETTSYIKNNNSTIDKALNKTSDDLNESFTTDISATNIGIEDKDFIYIPHTIKDTDSLQKLIEKFTPNYTYESVEQAILKKNNLSDISHIKSGDLILIPKEISLSS